MAATLIRAPIATEPSPDDTFATEVANILGYTALEKQVVPSTLREVYRKLDIAPFTPESVREYQERMVRQTIGSKIGNDSPFVVFLLAVTLVGSVLGALTTGYFCLICNGMLNENFDLYATQIGVAKFMASLFMTALVSFVTALVISGPKTEARWVMRPLTEYGVSKGIVPTFALQTAMDIKALAPEVCVFVEYMEVSRLIRDPDPFLVIRLNGHLDYLEVWSEPNFKAERKV
jgi:hypothetical protein